MTHMIKPDPVAEIRASMPGYDGVLKTPFGLRPLVYADYAASGRGDVRIEAQLAQLQENYANPHTDDSVTGRASTAWLKRAEAMIKVAVNASDDDVVVACGSGATGAIAHLQSVLGLAEAPATRAFQKAALRDILGSQAAAELDQALTARAPVVFLGPYEHHSNELTWRETRAKLVKIELDEFGGIDFAQLEAELANPAYAGRRKIGAFSAASNVTGMRTDVARLARLLHSHGGVLCLDCAASAPYLPIDMNPVCDPESGPDAVYFSPHKLIGGPGSCGLLVFKSALYRKDLPPTLPGGGTVTYVTPDNHDYIDDIAARERAGTPGVLQMARAALSLSTLKKIGYDTIDAREQSALNKAFKAWGEDRGIEILGSTDPEARIGIVSFNIREGQDDILHPRFVATLLNDLFGIQARAGCSCAGPYAHDLLKLDDDMTQAHRRAVLSGYAGLRPGWCRVSLHWVMSDAEIEYIIEAIRFIAAYGARFVPLYDFDVQKGSWSKRDGDAEMGVITRQGGAHLQAVAMAEAHNWAKRLDPRPASGVLPQSVEGLRRFPIPA